MKFPILFAKFLNLRGGGVYDTLGAELRVILSRGEHKIVDKISDLAKKLVCWSLW